MKKFLSIFLCTLSLMVLFVVPHTASASNTSALGTWFIDEFTSTASYGEFNITGSAISEYGNYELYRPSYFEQPNFYIGYHSLGQYAYANSFCIRYVDSDSYNKTFFSSPANVSLTITGGTDDNNPALISWLEENAVRTHNADGTEAFCDNSVCQVPEAVEGEYCPECRAVFRLGSPSFPSISSIWNVDSYPYGVLQMNNDNTYSLYFLSSQPVTSDGSNIRLTDGTFQVYNLVDSQWSFVRDGRGAVEFQDIDSGKLVSVSYDIEYNGNILMYADTSFFQKPLWAQVGKVTQGAIPNLATMVAGAMKILLVCGIGCLALLVVLVLFGKVLKPYLNR